jgi:molybdopterin/thiamine biosynthesis adenylyltransferase
MNFEEEQFLERYQCSLVLEGFGIEGQKNLRNKSIFVVGLGGIGSVVAWYLVANGFGKVGICDYDVVNLNNLTRQFLYDQYSLNRFKAIVALEKLSLLNDEVVIDPIVETVTHQNAESLFKEYDIIVECSDSLETKFLVNRVCLKMAKPYIITSAISYEGNVLLVFDREKACLECIFEKDDGATGQTCSSIGVLPTVPGIIGLFAVTELLKYIGGKKNYPHNFIKVNFKDNIVRFLEVKRQPFCNLHI